MYTFAGAVPMVLQVALAKDTVIVIGSVTLNMVGVIVTCENNIVENRQVIKFHKTFFFIALILLKKGLLKSSPFD
jgi:hypothetical protein